jgi:hypothetical protein
MQFTIFRGNNHVLPACFIAFSQCVVKKWTISRGIPLAIKHKNLYGPITLDDSSLFAIIKSPCDSILLENQFFIEARFNINIGLSIPISEGTNSQLRVIPSKSRDDSKSGEILNETIERGRYRKIINGRSP